MPNAFKDLASSLLRIHGRVAVLRFRRCMNRSVAGMLAGCERQLMCQMAQKRSGAKDAETGLVRFRFGMRAAVLSITIAGLVSPMTTVAEERIVPDQIVPDQGRTWAQQARWPRCKHAKPYPGTARDLRDRIRQADRSLSSLVFIRQAS